MRFEPEFTPSRILDRRQLLHKNLSPNLFLLEFLRVHHPAAVKSQWSYYILCYDLDLDLLPQLDIQDYRTKYLACPGHFLALNLNFLCKVIKCTNVLIMFKLIIFQKLIYNDRYSWEVAVGERAMELPYQNPWRHKFTSAINKSWQVSVITCTFRKLRFSKFYVSK